MAQPARASRLWTPREGVLRHLVAAADDQIVIVRSPGGTGKSIVLRQLADRGVTGRATTYLSCAGLSRRDLWLRALATTHDTTLSEGEAWAAYALEAEKVAAVLVLDDYDDNDWITDDILDLLRAAPRATVVVASRWRSRLEAPLVGMEFDSSLLDPAALMFTPEEVADVFERNGQVLPERILSSLRERLGGWPAVIQLAAVHARADDASLRSDEDVARLAEMVLDEYADQFLASAGDTVSAALLRRLSVPPHLTEALLHDIDVSVPNPAEVLDELERCGIARASVVAGVHRFVLSRPLRSSWVRQLQRHDPDVVETLRRQSARHLANFGDPLLAAELAADTKDWDTVLDVFDDCLAEAWSRSPERTMALARRFSSSATDRLLARAAHLTVLDPDEVSAPARAAATERALQQFRRPGARRPSDAVNLQEERHYLYLLRRVGEISQAVEQSEHLAEHLRRSVESDVSQRQRADLSTQIGLALLHSGQLRDARWRLADAVRIADTGALRTEARGALAVAEMLWGNVDAAAAVLDAIDADGDSRWVDSPWGGASLVARAFVELERGQHSAAAGTLDALEQGPSTEFWPLVSALSATARLLAHEPNSAMSALARSDEVHHRAPASHLMRSHLVSTRANVLVALRQPRRASALFRGPFGASDATVAAMSRTMLFSGQEQAAYLFSQQWVASATASPRATLESLLLAASACLRLNRVDSARDALRKALALSQSTGLSLAWTLVPEEDRLGLRSITTLPIAAMMDSAPPQFGSRITVPQLTTRELVVLARIQSGDSVAQISESLVVSINTVKTQLKSLYRKLGAANRSEAVRLAMEWGISASQGDSDYDAG